VQPVLSLVLSHVVSSAKDCANRKIWLRHPVRRRTSVCTLEFAPSISNRLSCVSYVSVKPTIMQQC
jgi:hypothetical protein